MNPQPDSLPVVGHPVSLIQHNPDSSPVHRWGRLRSGGLSLLLLASGSVAETRTVATEASLPVQVETNLLRRATREVAPEASVRSLVSTNAEAVARDQQLEATPPADPRPVFAPQLIVEQNRVVGVGSEYSVAFAGTLRSPVSVGLRQRRGTMLRSGILGLAYLETDTQRSVLIAEVRAVAAWLLPPDRVVYVDAFDGDGGLVADVVYTCGTSSFEQDVVLRTQPPPPSAYGFNPDTTEFAVLTEFVDAPVPRQRLQQLDFSEWNARWETDVPPLVDEIIGLDSMRLVLGRAFSLETRQETIPVRKAWRILDGRCVLIESTPYKLLQPLQQALPRPTASLRAFPRHHAEGRLTLPQFIEVPTEEPAILIARADPMEADGVVIDYVLVTSPLLNVNFSNTVWPNKVGTAAVGIDTEDFWNFSVTVLNPGTVTFSNLYWSGTAPSPVDMTLQNAPGVWRNGVTNDIMYYSYAYSWNAQPVYVSLTQVPEDVYDLYVYGHSPSDTGNGLFKLRLNGNQVGYKGTTIWGQEWANTDWTEGEQYVVFRNLYLQTNDTLQLEVLPTSNNPTLSGLQLVPSAAVSGAVPDIEFLINVDTGSSGTPKTGFAAIGLGANDTWNLYHQSGSTYGVLTNLLYADASTSPAGLIIHNAPGYWGLSTPPRPLDPMYDGYIYPWDGGSISASLTNLADGYYDLYLYAHAYPASATSVLNVTCNGTDYGTRGTTCWGDGWATAQWEEGQQYVAFRKVFVTGGAPVQITISPHQQWYTHLNGLQLMKRVDGDEDGMPDAWEITHFGHLDRSGAGDYDGDGLSDVLEYQLGVDPADADSDDDGMIDQRFEVFISHPRKGVQFY